MIAGPTLCYDPDTDTLAIELAADGGPRLWRIENASVHPELIAAALRQIRHRGTDADDFGAWLVSQAGRLPPDFETAF